MFFFFQAEDGIRDLVRSRGLGDVYKRQGLTIMDIALTLRSSVEGIVSSKYRELGNEYDITAVSYTHLTLPTSDLV